MMKRITKITSLLLFLVTTSWTHLFAQEDLVVEDKALNATEVVNGKIIAFKGISGTNSQWINWEKTSTSTPVKAGFYEVENAPSGTGIVLKRLIDSKYIGISTAIKNNNDETTGYNLQFVESKENAVAFTVSTPELDGTTVTGIHELSLPDMTGSMNQNQSTEEKQAVLQTSWAYGKQIRLTANIDGKDFYTNIQTSGTGIPRLADGKGSWSVIMAYNAEGYTPMAFNGYYRIISGLQGFESTQGVKKAMYDAENGEYRWNTLDETLPQFIWNITTNDFGEMTIKNCYTEQYMSGMGTIGEEPIAVKFNDLGSSEFNLLINNNTMHANNHASGAGISGNIISWGGGANSASSWKLEAVAEETADEINTRYKNKLAFTTLAKEALEELQTNYNYTVDADFSNALVNDASRITSNATEPSEGAIANLIDGNASTYWHSCWQNGPTEQHYLQFDLGEGNEQEALAITYWKRQNSSNYPTALTFKVSNDGENWKTVQRIENLDTSAPTTENPGYTSKGFSLFGSYRYLRVLLQSNSNLVNGYSFTHFSEFRIHPVTKATGLNDQIDETLVTNLSQLIFDKENETNITADDVISLQTALEAYRKATLTNKYTQLIADLTSANKLADDPAIGQYAQDKADALSQLCTSGNATSTELDNAYTELMRSLNAYVFTINSANTNNYSDGSSIYDDNSGTLKWKTTNKYDKSMLWKFEDATSNTISSGNNYVVSNLNTGNNFKGAEYITIGTNADNKLFFVLNGNIPSDLNSTSGGCIHAAQAGNEVVTWNASAPASTWTFEYVGESKNIEKVKEEQLAAYAELTTLIASCEPFKDKIGTGLNQFTSDNLLPALTAAETVVTTDIYEYPELDAITARDALKAAKEVLTINQPETGKFYRIKSASYNKYITSNQVPGEQQRLVADATDNTTVFYLSDDNRLTCSNICNMDLQKSIATGLGTVYEFLINNNGYYMIKAQGNETPIYAHTDPNKGDVLTYDFNGGSYADRLQNAWILEEVTEADQQIKLNKNITTQYATIAAPVALNIPAGIKAYTAKVNGETATLTEITSGVIPAGVAAVLESSEASSYDFTFAASGSTDNENDLVGVYTATEIPAETAAYILTSGNQGVGFYLLNSEDRELAANKAYLVAPAEAAGIKAFTFGGTTGIESTEATAKTAEEYYDLQGRRVLNPTKGIYVTKSGKKVLFTK